MTYQPNCKPINSLALAMGRYLTARELEVNPHPDLERAARRAFALIDWVEPEIDPLANPLEYAYSTVLYHLGLRMGFKSYEVMTDTEIIDLQLDALI
jgi:hypothetical protein